jgi:phosphoribosylaminoimidazole-succinocarboxamide synthase
MKKNQNCRPIFEPDERGGPRPHHAGADDSGRPDNEELFDNVKRPRQSYSCAGEIAAQRGLILVDTKNEFGIEGRWEQGEREKWDLLTIDGPYTRLFALLAVEGYDDG